MVVVAYGRPINLFQQTRNVATDRLSNGLCYSPDKRFMQSEKRVLVLSGLN